jgi:hypothetical protein
MIKSTPLQKLKIFGLLNVSFSYFTIWNQFDIWITFGIIEKSLQGRSIGTIQPSSALDSPALQGSGPTMAAPRHEADQAASLLLPLDPKPPASPWSRRPWFTHPTCRTTLSLPLR